VSARRTRPDAVTRPVESYLTVMRGETPAAD